MAENKLHGDIGESEIVGGVSCPNCGRKLMSLPGNYPLFDVQCTGCVFRAQVKTNHCKPKDVIFGAGWDIMSKVLKSGFMPPPLIVNFKWTEDLIEKQEILFFPFVPKSHLRPYQLSDTAVSKGSRRFNYADLRSLPHFRFLGGKWEAAKSKAG
jgi:hypothetical protein